MINPHLLEYNLVECLIYAAAKKAYDANSLPLVEREAAQMVMSPQRSKAEYANLTPMEKRYVWR
jgi:hypothetical protein